MDAPLGRWAWLPLPLLLALTVLLWVAPVEGTYDPRWFLPATYLLIVLPVGGFVAFLAARGYRAGRGAGLILLGCGALLWGFSGLAGGLMAARGHNAMVTAHNVLAWLAAACHFLGVFAFGRPSPAARPSDARFALAYLAVPAMALALIAAIDAELMPRFIDAGSSTGLRDAVLVSALAMFLVTGVRLVVRARGGDAFPRWYGMALLLIAVGMMAIQLEPGVGTALSWTGRIAQLTGTLYMLAAALAVTRRASMGGPAGYISLAEAELRLGAVADLAGDGIVLHELMSGPGTGFFIHANPAICAMLGYSAEEMARLTPLDLVAPEERHLLPEDALRMATDGELTHMKTLVGRDGRRIPAEIRTRRFRHGEREMAVSVVRDVGARLESQRHSAELAAIVESSQDAIIGKDLGGVVRSWNRGAEQTFGYRAEEIIGRPIAVLFPPDRMDEEPRLLAQIAAGKRVAPFDTVRLRKDGSPVSVSITLSPVLDASGQVIGAADIARDIGESRRLIAALEAAKDAADEANRAKSAFLANMSHEIRTPLNVILGMIHLVKKEGLTARQAERLDHVNAAADHLLAVINDILDLSKIEAGKLELEEGALSVGEILANVATLLAPKAAAKGLALTVDPYRATARLRGDATRLTQALLNLGNNAVKFTERGRIAIRAVPVEETGDGAVLRFEVEDSGIGIAAEEMPRLFMAFEQADRSTTRRHGGTGLGLAITRKLAECMGGQAGASSTPGEGSRFWFTVRLTKDGDAAASPRRDPAAAEEAVARDYGGHRVLLVEDDADNRMVMSELLGAMELRVDAAADGVAGVELARRNAYDLILIDVQMPRMDGVEATRRIRALPGREAVPIIAITANAFSHDKARCLAAGMDEFVSKPVSPGDFCNMVLKWLAKAPASA
ncbi:MAG: PAS domain S-box protein [Ignavibacteria bacterium]